MSESLVNYATDSLQDISLRLKEVYTEENLNQITAKIIGLYKLKYFSEIKNILKVISQNSTSINFNEDCKINKVFSRLVLLYHPDKLLTYLNIIESGQNDLNELNQITHIFITISELDKISNNYTSQPSSNFDSKHKDYSGWEDFYSSEKERFSGGIDDELDDVMDDYYDLHDDYYDLGEGDFLGQRKKSFSFYDIIIEENILNDTDQIDMSNLNISDLDGIDDFVYLKILNLSGNNLTDVSELMELDRLEELYLSQNQIGYIDRLCNLQNLKVLDLSDNDIDDISPLFELNNLEFVNLLNNPISKAQINELLENKVIVVY